MKFAIVALALLGVVAADVSHLNNMYLPPVLAGLGPKEHVSYAQQTQEIPQAPVHEVTDNSVVEDAAAQEEAQKASGQLVVESVKFGGAGFGGHAVAAVAQHVKTAAGVAHQVHAHVQQSVVAAVEQQHEVEHQEPEQQYYTGLVHHEGQDDVSAGAVEQQQQHDVNADVAVPQEAAHYGQEHEQHHVEEQHFHHVEHHAEPEHQHSAVHVEHHVAADAPVAQEFAQQADYTSVSVGSSASSSASSGIDTQYGANGGYVY